MSGWWFGSFDYKDVMFFLVSSSRVRGISSLQSSALQYVCLIASNTRNVLTCVISSCITGIDDMYDDNGDDDPENLPPPNVGVEGKCEYEGPCSEIVFCLERLGESVPRRGSCNRADSSIRFDSGTCEGQWNRLRRKLINSLANAQEKEKVCA